MHEDENAVDNIGYILYTGIRDTKEGLVMPVISRFEGIVIKMYLRQKEHNPPHIHAIYGEYIGMFSLSDGEMFEGDIPAKGQKLVKEFIEYYRDRLLTMWETQQFEVLPPVK
jgi:hypothetical protein